MRRLVRVFQNFPIERKLLLTSIIPVVALILSSLVIYRGVRTFADDEDQLNNVYLAQTAAEYMRLVVDLETGFRGFVLTRQDGYLHPYRVAHDHILTVGDSLYSMVEGRGTRRYGRNLRSPW